LSFKSQSKTVVPNVQHIYGVPWQAGAVVAFYRWSELCSNRPTAANRAEETLPAFVVAEWNAVPPKTDKAMVLNARV
jgi:cytosine/uracil/thiamine/allantoin permease